MNYIAEINAFYNRIEINPLPYTAIALWHALMSVANKAGWPDTFTVSASVLGYRTGLNDSAFKRARNQLAEAGLIEWHSRGGNLSAQYSMKSLVQSKSGLQSEPQNEVEPQNEPQIDTQCEPQIDLQDANEPQFELQNEPQFELQSGLQVAPINKHKLKHKQINRPPISPAESLERFLSAYPLPHGKINRYISEIAFVDCLMTKQVTEEELIAAAGNYAEKLRIEGRDKDSRFIKNPENFLKDLTYCQYLPGVYVKPDKPPDKNKFNNYEQRDYDFETLEKELLSN